MREVVHNKKTGPSQDGQVSLQYIALDNTEEKADSWEVAMTSRGEKNVWVIVQERRILHKTPQTVPLVSITEPRKERPLQTDGISRPSKNKTENRRISTCKNKGRETDFCTI
jgi:hypothetical protein